MSCHFEDVEEFVQNYVSSKEVNDGVSTMLVIDKRRAPHLSSLADTFQWDPNDKWVVSECPGCPQMLTDLLRQLTATVHERDSPCVIYVLSCLGHITPLMDKAKRLRQFPSLVL